MNRNKGAAVKLIRYAVFVLIILFAGFFAAHFIVQRTVVHGGSMQPTLYDGDNLIIDRVSYASFDPKRYDIVVFSFGNAQGTYYIKRVIGLPGETVQITDDGDILINGQVLNEHYGNAVITDPGLASYEIRLGSGEYFVLGDNRNHSEDSRFADVGIVKREQIMGKAVFRFFPFTRIGRIR